MVRSRGRARGLASDRGLEAETPPDRGARSRQAARLTSLQGLATAIYTLPLPAALQTVDLESLPAQESVVHVAQSLSPALRRTRRTGGVGSRAEGLVVRLDAEGAGPPNGVPFPAVHKHLVLVTPRKRGLAAGLSGRREGTKRILPPDRAGHPFGRAVDTHVAARFRRAVPRHPAIAVELGWLAAVVTKTPQEERGQGHSDQPPPWQENETVATIERHRRTLRSVQ